jgi:hypothetical protein
MRAISAENRAADRCRLAVFSGAGQKLSPSAGPFSFAGEVSMDQEDSPLTKSFLEWERTRFNRLRRIRGAFTSMLQVRPDRQEQSNRPGDLREGRSVDVIRYSDPNKFRL